LQNDRSNAVQENSKDKIIDKNGEFDFQIIHGNCGFVFDY
jgi:hypothetical protein